jgi:hypothetical protein
MKQRPMKQRANEAEDNEAGVPQVAGMTPLAMSATDAQRLAWGEAEVPVESNVQRLVTVGLAGLDEEAAGVGYERSVA